ncbi:DUF4259 domain-containing protein [Streptomyces sp. NPDC046859]|uniref:DUF4259 domain-containing protein n=1 Tax=Streptomyces sp. NPDC046859 TaxID=3155734 RepID=UPI0033F18376
MGTWDIGPFDNDTAADFANDLDDAAEGERERLVRGALMRAVDNHDYLEAPDAEEAVAAAALIAAQCPGGEPVSLHYGPEKPIPRMSADVRRLAAEALDRVLADKSELSDLWGAEEGGRWRGSVAHLRRLLDPASGAQGDALFEV